MMTSNDHDHKSRQVNRLEFGDITAPRYGLEDDLVGANNIQPSRSSFPSLED